MVRKVYIIDDDDISVYLTSLVLEEAGFAGEIHTYGSADEALGHLPLQSGKALPEIILLDLNMPQMSGWDFLEALGQHEQDLLGRLGVFILTSSIAASDKERSQRYPLVRGFLHKPLDDESLHLIRETMANPSR